MDVQAYIDAGYSQNECGQWQKFTSTTTVKTEDGDIEVKGYIPSYQSYAKPTIDTVESATPTRARQIYLQQVARVKAEAEEEARKAEAKVKLQGMTRHEAIKFKNENGLNSKLTLEEQRLLHKQMERHRSAREELMKSQQEERRRFGDGAKKGELLRILSELSPEEKAIVRSLLVEEAS